MRTNSQNLYKFNMESTAIDKINRFIHNFRYL